MCPDLSAGNPQLHPIAVVVERTGISQDLLRVWERRYRAVEPIRSPGGQRLYSDADVERLRLLDRALAGGRRIGQVAHLATPQLAELVDGDRVADRQRAPAPEEPVPDTDRGIVDVAMQHVKALDARAVDELLRGAAMRHGTEGFLTRTVVPLLRRIGDEWHGGRLAISEEHLASTVVENVVVDGMRAMRALSGAPVVVIATPTGSRHVIAAAMAGAIAAAEGWNVLFLGGELPVSEIASTARTTGAKAVALSVLYASDREEMVGMLQTLRDTLPPRVRLIVGGAAIAPEAARLREGGIVVGTTLFDLRLALREASGSGR